MIIKSTVWCASVFKKEFNGVIFIEIINIIYHLNERISE